MKNSERTQIEKVRFLNGVLSKNRAKAKHKMLNKQRLAHETMYGNPPEKERMNLTRAARIVARSGTKCIKGSKPYETLGRKATWKKADCELSGIE